MKQAVFLIGEIRTFREVWEYWDFSPNVDFFISTWNHTTNTYTRETVTDDWFLGFKKKYPKPFHNTTIKLNDRKHELFAHGNLPNVIYHMQRCLEMLEESGNEYQSVSILRIDSLIRYNEEEVSRLVKENPNTIFSQTDDENIQKGWMNDFSIWGSQSVMTKWVSGLDVKKHRIAHESLGIYTKEGFSHKKDIKDSVCFPIRIYNIQHIEQNKGERQGNELYDYINKRLKHGVWIDTK